MRPFVFSLIFISFICPVFAFSFDDMPDSLQIREIPGCIGCSKIKSGNKLIGSLYRLGAKEKKRNGLIFEYFDENNQKRITLKFQYDVTDGLLFFIYDANNELVGQYIYLISDEYQVYCGFQIYSADGTKLLMQGVKNSFGTRLTLLPKGHSGKKSDIMMELTCSFFSSKRNWDSTMINPTMLSASGVNPDAFAAVLAFQSLTQLQPLPWFERSMPSKLNKTIIDPDIQALLEKLNQVSQEQDLPYEHVILSEKVVKSTVDFLNHQYIQRYNNENLSEKDQINQFVNFCIEVIYSNEINAEQKNAVLQFITKRLKEMAPLLTF